MPALIAIVFIIIATASHAAEYRFPEDARVVNVRDFGAKGDGKTDDTYAIRLAIYTAIERSRYANPPFVYFPNGTYLISHALESRVDNMGWSGGWRAGMQLVGQDRDKTVIRLADNLPEFKDPKNARAMIITGSETDNHAKSPSESGDGGGNRAFRHNVMNLTLHTGKGNPGACGVDFIANNRGTLEDLLIIDGDDTGSTGIVMTRNWPGPALIKRVEIRGFARGVAVGSSHYSMTFEHLVLKQQRKVGLYNTANVLGVRGLISDNTVPAVQMTSENGHITLIDSVLRGGKEDGVAIDSMGSMLVQRVRIEGYGKAFDDQSVNNRDVAGDPAGIDIPWHIAGNFNVVGNTDNAFILPVKETPEYDSSNLDDWANVLDYGAHPNDGWDDSEAIQKAIDSGKSVVFFPSGNYQIKQDIIIRGKVRKLMGGSASIKAMGQEPPFAVIRYEGGEADACVIEHFWFETIIVHASSKALAIRHSDIHNGYYNTAEGTGDFFLEDTMGKPIRILYPQSFWARQLNTEYGTEPLLENHGGNVWILVQKTEGQMPAIATYDGGRTELLVGENLALRPSVGSENPCFINEGGFVSLCSTYSHGEFRTFVRDGKDEEAKLLSRKDAPRPTTFYVNTLRNGDAEGEIDGEDERDAGEGKGFTETAFSDASFSRRLWSQRHGSATIRHDASAGPGEPRTGAAYVYTATFTPVMTGTYRFSIRGTRGDYYKRCYVDGVEVVNNRDMGSMNNAVESRVPLRAGTPYPLKLEIYVKGSHVWVPLGITVIDEAGKERSSSLSSKMLEPAPLEQPTVSFVEVPKDVVENGGLITIRVLRSGGLERALALQLRSSGSALASGACQPLPETISFPVGKSETSFQVSPVDNQEPGGQTDLEFWLVGHPDYLVTGSHVKIAIRDDETPIVGKGDGLQADYFRDTRFEHSLFQRIDTQIDFDWTETTPDKRLPLRKPWSVRWLGGLTPTFSEAYTFTVEGVPEARLWIAGEKVVDLRQSYLMQGSGETTLTAGKEVDLRLDVPFPGVGQLKLYWQSQSQPRQIVPARQLNPKGFLGENRIDLENLDLSALPKDDDGLPVSDLLPE